MSSQATTPAAIERVTRYMFTRIITRLAASLPEQDFSIAQIAALHLIDQEGDTRIADIGEALGRSPSAASRIVDALVQRGLVERREDPEDRRAKTLRLSAAGKRLVEKLGDERAKVAMGAAQTLPAEVGEAFVKAMTAALRR